MIWRKKRSPNLLLLLSLGFLLSLSFVAATPSIAGDKKAREPDPLPPKPAPNNVVPTVSEVEPLPEGVGVEVKTPAAAVVPVGVATIDVTTGAKVTDEKEHSSSISDDSQGGVIPKSSRETLISESHSFFLAFLMIIFSEIGDKTFLIAALMAMKHSRMLVFSAAFASLVVMTILSALLGHAVPTLIPKWLTNWIAAGLFLVFGLKMLSEGLKMEKGTEGVKEEMKEVEQELVEKEAEARGRSGSVASILEEGRGHGSRASGKNHLRRHTASPSISDSEDESFNDALRQEGGSGNMVKTVTDGVQNLAGLLLSPAWVQTFVMTFLGEWGDRSQIATIAMAAGQDYWFVILGSIVGHGCCTAGAVVGGRLLAERISVRNVTLGGSVAFLAFSLIYLVEAIYA